VKALRWVVGTIGELLITIGLLLLLFVAWQLWWTDVTANREQAVAIQALERGFTHVDSYPSATPGPTATPDPVATLKKVPFGDAFAIVRIPRFGAGYARPVLQGTDHQTLGKGVGHYVGTAMPGLVGNFATAGHRTTYGKPYADIDKLRPGDFIVIETKANYIVYAVQRHVIVTPDHVEVIAPVPPPVPHVPQHPGAKPTEAWMTMTACHPKFSAQQRYVVFSKLMRIFTRAGGLPASFMAVPAGAG
jgi:LPXTG-site transpeptidase (sortase) family protein